ncbi:hypothetical protein SAMN05892877_11795 [Rhizobium subbaraonis]|uniref:Phage integrase family protein n=1 Tax=Rhizobium subbaraonis TaxID=908946 RepID=A0A285UY94_9HYPH|nr:hypothetical protein [Rhizobium subbaraonis]SOC45706.1 hypothetical protein SAMN05892877_11795 [Rhizobium subbaraonis]
MVAVELPRYTSFKTLADGSTGYYWTCPTRYRKRNCPYLSAALGVNLSQKELNASAELWNERLNGWLKEQSPMDTPDTTRYGTVEWLVNTYLKHDAFLERVSEFSRPDYRRVLDRVCATEIIRDDIGLKARIGDAKIANITVSTATKIYEILHGQSARTGEKVVTYCKAMWKRMKPHHPDLFRQDTPNPWEGVTLKKRTKKVKGHVERATVYAFADGAVALGRPELAAAAVLAFEFLMRPSSIGAGYAAWSGYRGESEPDKIIIGHRKTDERAMHPLEYIDADGSLKLLYADAERILKQVPKNGLSIVCQRNGNLFGDGTRLSQEVTDIANKLADKGTPVRGFTLDKARHGGMTELEERGLTEGQGRALSKHRTSGAYRGYAKDTEKRVLEATKKRFGHSERAEKVNEFSTEKKAK